MGLNSSADICDKGGCCPLTESLSWTSDAVSWSCTPHIATSREPIV